MSRVEVVETINVEETRENTRFLPGVKIPQGMRATGDLSRVIDHGEILLMVVPTPFVEHTLGHLYEEGFERSSCDRRMVC